MGRRVSRAVRRAVRRTIVEPIRRTSRILGDMTGALPVVGDVLGATGLVDTPAQKEAERQEQLERERQARLEQMQREQDAEEEWAKQQSQFSQQIMGTQQKAKGYNDTTDLSNVLSGETDSEDEEDILKKILKRK